MAGDARFSPIRQAITRGRSYMGPPGSMPERMTMTQEGHMMTQGGAFMEGQRHKAEEKEKERKKRLAEQPKRTAAQEYMIEMARQQRKRRGMDVEED